MGSAGLAVAGVDEDAIGPRFEAGRLAQPWQVAPHARRRPAGWRRPPGPGRRGCLGRRGEAAVARRGDGREGLPVTALRTNHEARCPSPLPLRPLRAVVAAPRQTDDARSGSRRVHLRRDSPRLPSAREPDGTFPTPYLVTRPSPAATQARRPWTSEDSSSEQAGAIMTPSPRSSTCPSRGWTRPPDSSSGTRSSRAMPSRRRWCAPGATCPDCATRTGSTPGCIDSP